MFTKLFFTALVATLATVRADPHPSEPGPGDIFNEGADCKIGWDVDPSGTWKVMNIELMSGSNLDMNHITTVASVDATDATNNTFTYPCPDVTPNSAIYFYQFTSPASKTTYWTTRFTIAGSAGQTEPPTNATQANGDPIAWGMGSLQDTSKATPPPPPAGSGLGTGSQTPAGNSTSTNSSNVTTPTPPPSSPSPTPQSQQSGNSTNSSGGMVKSASSLTSSATPSGQGDAANNSAAFALDMPLSHIAVSCAMTLLGFAMML